MNLGLRIRQYSSPADTVVLTLEMDPRQARNKKRLGLLNVYDLTYCIRMNFISLSLSLSLSLFSLSQPVSVEKKIF
jgi:hypothetical protein